jgi:hypothetical protein
MAPISLETDFYRRGFQALIVTDMIGLTQNAWIVLASEAKTSYRGNKGFVYAASAANSKEGTNE